MKKRLLSLLLLAACYISAIAVPVMPGQRRLLTLADGTTISVLPVGDEYFHCWRADDGRLFTAEGTQLTVEQCNAMAINSRLEWNQGMQLSTQQLAKNGKKRIALGSDHGPFEGMKKCLCILMEFPDKKFQENHDVRFYEDYLNVEKPNLDLGGGFKQEGSVRDYFKEQSSERFVLNFDIVGPYTTKNFAKYYAGATPKSSEIFTEGLRAAHDDGVDFTQYDWDGDGISEPVFVLYCGMGQADNVNNQELIWPHKGYINPVVYDGVAFVDYACGNELMSSGYHQGIGTMCHEYSHCLGFPDMYDLNDNWRGNYGTCFWDVMDKGCNAGDFDGERAMCNRPCSYNAYERWEAGWLTPIELNEECEVTGMKGISEGGDAYVIYNDANHNEYILLENRTKVGSDAAVFGEGLVAYHVDYDRSVWRSNYVNTVVTYGQVKNDHPRMYVMPADGSSTSASPTTGYIARADIAADVYPYASNNALTDFTSPSTTLYRQNRDKTNLLHKPVYGITRSPADGSISFKFKNNTKQIQPAGVKFYESFNMCTGVGGNDGTFLRTGTMKGVTDNGGWTMANLNQGDRCARLGTAASKGRAVLPDMDFEAGVDYELQFRAVPGSNSGTTLTLSFSGDAHADQTTFVMTPDQWTDFSTHFTATGKNTITLITDKAFYFLDEVKILDNKGDGISPLRRTSADQPIYNLAGQRLQTPARGLMIVGGKKVIMK